MTALPAMAMQATIDAVAADDHVVPDLHEVVDLGAFADPGAPEARAVDGGARADLHVVVDLHDAGLPHLAMASLFKLVAEAIRADDDAGVQDDALAEAAAEVDRGVGEELRVPADADLRPDVAPGADLDAIGDLRAFIDHRIGADADLGGIKLRRGGNRRGRMHARDEGLAVGCHSSRRSSQRIAKDRSRRCR